MAAVVPYVIYAAVSVAVGFVMQSLQKPIEGAKLGDIAKQTAREGGERLIVWGIVRPIGGNIVACSEPSKTTTTSGGKGGGSSSSRQTTESVYRTYAIGVCEGPITGYRRIWRNNKIVYDARLDENGVLNEWGAANNATFLQAATLYNGYYDQLPDAALESIFGVGEVPAMRGTAYMVMAHENLTDLGGAVPQYIFEVVRAEGIPYTSRPYAVEDVDSMSIDTTSIASGVFRAQLLSYDDGLTEGIEIGETIDSGVFRQSLFTYDDGLTEGIEIGETIDSGNMRVGLILYEDALPEGITVSSTEITSGYLNEN